MNAERIILDRLMYSAYAHHRLSGIASERLIPFFDVETFEPIYRKEHEQEIAR